MANFLNRVNIDEAVGEIERFLDKNDIDSKDKLRIRIGVEETLLRYMSHFGEDILFRLRYGRVFGVCKVTLLIRGGAYDPFASEETEEEEFMRRTLVNMGKIPDWRWNRGENRVSFGVEKKGGLPDWVLLLITVVLAIAGGVALKSAPESVTTFVSGRVLTPLSDLFMKLLNGTAVPLIFLSVVWSIYSVGDGVSFSTLGRKLLGRFLLWMFILNVAMGFLSLGFFHFGNGNARTFTGFGQVYQMLLDVVPGNVIRPFYDGNTAQVVFVGVILGIAMLRVNDKSQTVADLVQQTHSIVGSVMGFIVKMLPVFVFASIMNLILENDMSLFTGIYRPILVMHGASVLMLIIQTVAVCLKVRVSPILLWKKIMDTFLIALTTASSAAAFAKTIETCTERLGIKKSLAEVGTSFRQILYKISSALFFFVISLYGAEIAGMGISLSWVIYALVVSVILSIAVPPVPGAEAVALSVLLTQLGLPSQFIAVAIPIDTIVDFFLTATEVASGQLQVLAAAKDLNMLDREILQKP